MFHRVLIHRNESFILLGARGSGKSTWLKNNFKKNYVLYNLLDLSTQMRLFRKPELFAQELSALPKSIKWVLVDEIQKIPKLLDVIHHFIENSKIKFALTGSSARKLKRGSANLLAGRAQYLQMHPLTFLEMGDKFRLSDVLNWGALPKTQSTRNKSNRREYLNSYVQLYLREEIQQEQIVRKIEPFYNFLEVAAQADGHAINFSKIAKDVGVDTKTVISYFKVLEDTLMGFILPAYHRSIRKRQKLVPKFYFFDLGVRKTLEGFLDTNFTPRTSEWGRAFECFIINEIYRLNSYHRKFFKLSYLSVPPTGEIDLVVEKSPKEHILIEIKSTSKIGEDDIIQLKRFRDNFQGVKCFVLSEDPIDRKIENVFCTHWINGLNLIFK